jgi:hypothetical protein
MGLHVSLWYADFDFLGIYAESGIAGSYMLVLFLIFLRNLHTGFHSTQSFYKVISSWCVGPRPVILALMLMQDCEFEANLGYIKPLKEKKVIQFIFIYLSFSYFHQG